MEYRNRAMEYRNRASVSAGMEAKERQVEGALVRFVDALIASPCPGLENITDVAALVDAATVDSSVCDGCLFDEIESYLDSNRGFYGSTVTLLGGDDGKAVCSPYVYRVAEGGQWERTDSLMDASYKIDEQPWLREPVDTESAVWSDPYFDEGGGNITMITYSVPIVVEGRVVGVATTDLPVSSGVRVGVGVGVLLGVAAVLAHLL